MILSCSHIARAFNEKEVLRDVTFHIEEHDKAALIGLNGAGKSTLLKIIMGELQPDSGEFSIARGKSIGCLAQHQEFSSDETIYHTLMEVKQPILEMEQQLRALERQMSSLKGEALEQVMQTYSRLDHEFERCNGYAWHSEIAGVLFGLGFSEDEWHKPVNTLSGGQKTRVSLGKLLLTRPDILLLDEPTNHLDMSHIAWLESYIRAYDGTVLIVTHDRYFLDRIANKVIELEHGVATAYPGNYTEYSKKKAIVRAGQIRAYLNQQAEIQHQEAVIAKLRSFKVERFYKRAQSREKALEKMQLIDKPEDEDAQMKLVLTPAIESGKDVLTVTGLAKSFGDKHLFSQVSFAIHRGERAAVIGDNGSGKTTLLKMINGLTEPDAGEIRLGAKVHIGYYDQEHHNLHLDKTVFDEISDTYPEMNNTEIRSVLAAFLFTGEDVFKTISSLSGGERARVSLAKLMLSEANFLILDEPTNHLDVTSREILEEALNSYTGTVLYVSHDRYFINATATRILDIRLGTALAYIGNYDYYLEKKEDTEAAFTQARAAQLHGSRDSSVGGVSSASSPAADALPNTSSTFAENGKLSWQQQKEAQARARKLQNDLKKTEEEIHQLETRDQEIDTILADQNIFSDVAKLMELNQEKEKIAEQLEQLYDKWEKLAEAAG